MPGSAAMQHKTGACPKNIVVAKHGRTTAALPSLGHTPVMLPPRCAFKLFSVVTPTGNTQMSNATLPILALGLASVLGGCIDVPEDYGYGHGYGGYGHGYGGYGHGYSQGYGRTHSAPVRYAAPTHYAAQTHYAAPTRYTTNYGHQAHRHDHDRW